MNTHTHNASFSTQCKIIHGNKNCDGMSLVGMCVWGGRGVLVEEIGWFERNEELKGKWALECDSLYLNPDRLCLGRSFIAVRIQNVIHLSVLWPHPLPLLLVSTPLHFTPVIFLFLFSLSLLPISPHPPSMFWCHPSPQQTSCLATCSLWGKSKTKLEPVYFNPISQQNYYFLILNNSGYVFTCFLVSQQETDWLDTAVHFHASCWQNRTTKRALNGLCKKKAALASGVNVKISLLAWADQTSDLTLVQWLQLTVLGK